MKPKTADPFYKWNIVIEGKRYGHHAPHYRLTDCCGSVSSYMDTYVDYEEKIFEQGLCCHGCYKEVPEGQGDYAERLELSIPFVSDALL